MATISPINYKIIPTEIIKAQESYPNRAACCLLIRESDGFILSVSRKNNPADKGLPGGKCEPEETYLEAAKRELFEETGYIADNLEPVFSADGDTGCAIDIENPKLNSKGKYPCNSITFIAKTYKCQEDTNESGAVEWVHPSRVCSGSFAAYNTELFNEILEMI
jgi:8-oxo-dGTP pyrophosphatase MutT (NUDIX family)